MEVKCEALEPGGLEFKSQLQQQPTVCSWSSHLTSQNVKFSQPSNPSWACSEKQAENAHKALAHCLKQKCPDILSCMSGAAAQGWGPCSRRSKPMS